MQMDFALTWPIGDSWTITRRMTLIHLTSGMCCKERKYKRRSMRLFRSWARPRLGMIRITLSPHLRFLQGIPNTPGSLKVTINNRKRQYRAIGIWRKDQGDFILLTGFEKSGRSTNPPNAFEVATRLRNQFNQGRGTIHEHV
jgi:hypothetical protein